MDPLILFIYCAVEGAIVVFLIWVFLAFIPLLVGAPFVPTREETIEILRAHVRGRWRIIDLGSGDGRLLTALAEQNNEIHGYEINPWLVLQSRWRIRRGGLGNRVFVHWGNFWNIALKEYDTIIIYGFPTIMGRLEKRILKEVRPGAEVITLGFHFPNLKPTWQEGRIARYTIAVPEET